MPSRPATTPDELRDALLELAVAASGFARGRGREKARRALAAALVKANGVLCAECRPGGMAGNMDPGQFVRAYIASGSNWRDLTDAVNRQALNGCRNR